MHDAVGRIAARLGDFETARDHCRAALVLHRQHGDHDGEATSLATFGLIAEFAEQQQMAIDSYRQAVELRRTLGENVQSAHLFDREGHSHLEPARHEQAHEAWQKALELYETSRRPTETDHVQQNLHGPDDRAPAADRKAQSVRRIFINHRNSDDSFGVQAIHRTMTSRLGAEAVFIDSSWASVHNTEATEAVSAADVLLVIIGPRWLDATDNTGRRLLEDPEDPVRREIQLGYQLGKPVIPVYLGCRPLMRDQLPEPLQALAETQGVTIAYHRHAADLERLVTYLRQHFSAAVKHSPTT